MPTDYELTEDTRTRYDVVGDIATVSGLDFVEQAVMIDVFENVDLSTPSFDATAIERQRSAIAEVVDNNQFTRPPISVTVLTEDPKEGILTYQIQTSRIQLPIDTT